MSDEKPGAATDGNVIEDVSASSVSATPHIAVADAIAQADEATGIAIAKAHREALRAERGDETTSAGIASLASRALRAPDTVTHDEIRKLAASALTQRKPKRSEADEIVALLDEAAKK
jgi:hypothetical protein